MFVEADTRVRLFVPDCFSIKTLKRRRADTQVRPYKRENFPISFN